VDSIRDRHTAADRLLQPFEAAAELGVDTRSLRRYNAQGILSAKLTPGGHRRYWLSEVRSLSRETAGAAA
jgi:predicted site-specific integrase-resolvase